MALIPIDNVGETGIVKDINPWQLPPNVWSEGNNIRAEHGAIQKSPGYLEVMASCPIAPYYITMFITGQLGQILLGLLVGIIVRPPQRIGHLLY